MIEWQVKREAWRTYVFHVLLFEASLIDLLVLFVYLYNFWGCMERFGDVLRFFQHLEWVREYDLPLP